MTEVLDELKWRGLVEQHTDFEALKEVLDSGPVTFYCGFDPTAPSLHHGHLVQVMMMKHLQNAGHHPIALVGGATGLIGDPRDSGERGLNPTDVVASWTDQLRFQLERFLDFQGDNPAQIANNMEWIGSMSAIELLRDLGKHFRMGTMLNKDIVARRIRSGEGLSYTEFSYQILQAFDFLELFRTRNCVLETAGNDQWGNLVGGVDLIRKVTGKTAHALTTPIITKADGTKFGKSEGGAIWLSPELMSPYAFYQFWLQTADEDVIKMLKIFTFLSREDIEELALSVSEQPHLRLAQKRLAEEVTRFVHGQEALDQVLAATAALWGAGDLLAIDAQTMLSAVDPLPSGAVVLGETSVADAMVACGLEKGRSAARRTITANGLSINNQKISDPEAVISQEMLLPGSVVLLRKGKKNLATVRPVLV